MQLKNRFLISILLIAASGCSHLKTRDHVPQQPGRKNTPVVSAPVQAPVTASPADQTSSQPVAVPEETPVVVNESETASSPVKIPKIGLILGPGGARAWGHIGVLQEIQREKIPVVAVAGVEWGSVVAALYSNKGLANEAEWQMSKIKSDDVVRKSLIGGNGPGDVRSMSEFLRLAFGKLKVEEAKIPFGCPAQNFAKNQVFVMNRGNFDQLLPFCLAYPPYFRPWQSNVSAIREVKVLADYLRSRGATTIVLINVLPGSNATRPIVGDANGTDGILWNEISAFYSRPIPGVDQVLQIPLGNYGLMSFDDRREILQKGAEKSSPLIRQLSKRLGL